ncbi:MAG: DUF1080 domain-containing protein [Planctomycetota bacterium]
MPTKTTRPHGRHSLRVRSLTLCCLTCVALFSGSTSQGQESETATLDRRAMQREAAKQQEASKEDAKKTSTGKEGWIQLLPKEGLENWEITDFGLPGKVSREGELLVVEAGDPLNGITYTKKSFPKDNFEISLEAKRVEGNDFLCGLTFPVGKDGFCSFIAGGWGGGLVGLSNVDGFDASENATTTNTDFENNKWYTFKIRVDQEYIRAWINDEEYFRQEREGHEFSTRIEVYSSQPLGFCSYQSKVMVRDFKWRSTRVADKLAKRAAMKARKEGGSRSSPGTAAEPIQ